MEYQPQQEETNSDVQRKPQPSNQIWVGRSQVGHKGTVETWEGTEQRREGGCGGDTKSRVRIGLGSRSRVEMGPLWRN